MKEKRHRDLKKERKKILFLSSLTFCYWYYKRKMVFCSKIQFFSDVQKRKKDSFLFQNVKMNSVSLQYKWDFSEKKILHVNVICQVMMPSDWSGQVQGFESVLMLGFIWPWKIKSRLPTHNSWWLFEHAIRSHFDIGDYTLYSVSFI